MRVRISGGQLKGRRLPPSRGPGLRPTSERVRQAIFSILGPLAVSRSRVLELYAGTGIFGLEALSREADWVDFVESSRVRSRQIGASLEKLGLEGQAKVSSYTVERALGVVKGPYDLVFADPPYDQDPWAWLMPRLVEERLMSESGVVVAEHSSGIDLETEYGTLTLGGVHRYGDTAISIYRMAGKHG